MFYYNVNKEETVLFNFDKKTKKLINKIVKKNQLIPIQLYLHQVCETKSNQPKKKYKHKYKDISLSNGM